MSLKQPFFMTMAIKHFHVFISDAAKQNEDWDSSGKVDPNLQIPLLMQNKIPDGFETDDKLDVSLRPDEVLFLHRFR